jgi:hypothetical protein
MKCTLRELIDTRETSLIPSPQDKYRESRMPKPIPSVSNNRIRRSSKSAKKVMSPMGRNVDLSSRARRAGVL